MTKRRRVSRVAVRRPTGMTSTLTAYGRQLSLLAEVGRELAGTLDPAEAASRVVSAVRRLFGVRRVTLHRLDPATGALEPLAVGGDDDRTWRTHPLAVGIGVSGLAVQERRIVWTRHVLRDRRLQLPPWLREQLERDGLHAAVGVPLIAHGTVLGALTIGDVAGRTFSNADRGLLATFADQAALALENARLYAETARRLRETQALLDVARILASTLDPTRLLKEVAIKAAQVCEMERCTIVLWTEGRIIPLMSQFADGRHEADLWAKFSARKPYGPEEIPAHALAMQTRKPVVIDDTSTSELLPREWLETYGQRAYLGVPLIRRDEVIGMMNLDRTDHPHRFAPWQIDLATTIASQVALALENAEFARHTRERLRETEILGEVARRLALAGDLDTILQRIAEGARELTGSDMTRIVLGDAEHGARIRFDLGHRAEAWNSTTIMPGHGLIGLVLGSGRAQRTTDYVNDPRISKHYVAIAREDGVTTAMGVPIPGETAVQGALIVLNRSPQREFTDRHEAVLTRLADHAAIALRKAHLFAESDRRRREAQSLADVGRAISQSLRPVEVAGRIVENALQVFGSATATIYRLDAATGELVLLAGRGEGFEWTPVLPRGMGTLGLALRERRPVVTPDLLADPRVELPDDVREIIRDSGYQAVIALPLLVQDRVIGALGIGARRGRIFSEEEVRLAETLGHQAAIALENARLYDDAERGRRQAEILARVARTVTGSLDLNTVLHAVAEAAREVTGSDMAMIALREPGGETAAMRQWVGTRYPGYGDVRIAPGLGTGGQVLATGRPFRTACWELDPRISHEYIDLVRAEGIVAEMVVPIRIGDRVEGLLYAENRSERPFTDADEAGLVGLAHHAAIALQNAQLYEQAEARAEKLAALSKVTRLISASPRTQGVLHAIAISATTLLGARTARVWVAHPTERELRAETGFGPGRADRAVIRFGTGVVGRVFLRAQPDYAHDADDASAIDGGGGADDVRAYAAVPLVAGEEVLGVLTALFGRRPPFSDSEKELVSLLADQAAIAIRNSQSFERERMTRAAVEASEQRYRLLFDRSPAGIYRSLRDGSVTECNEAFARILGYPSRVAALRANAAEFYADPADRKRLVTHLVPGDILTNLEVEFRGRDGRAIWVLMNVLAAEEQGVIYYEGSIIDITDRKRAEEAERRTEALRSVNRLAVAAAHEINNPLAVIMGNLDLLARQAEREGRDRDRVEPALIAVRRVQEIVTRMGRITRLELSGNDSSNLPDMLDLRKSSAEPPPPPTEP
ncbi:MAG: GAF domain-containing protein [Candidatus Rokubacteria bacterium]|nr:GAF domain-containing protein [Candidatus Rokubacteria bacterium]